MGAADGVEVRVRPTGGASAQDLPRGLRVDLIDPGTDPEPAASASRPGGTSAGTDPSGTAPSGTGTAGTAASGAGAAGTGTSGAATAAADTPGTADAPGAGSAPGTVGPAATAASSATGAAPATAAAGTARPQAAGAATATPPRRPRDPPPGPPRRRPRTRARHRSAARGRPGRAGRRSRGRGRGRGASEAEAEGDAGAAAEAEGDAGTAAEADAAAAHTAPKPKIVTRKGWGADESLRESAFLYTSTVRAAFVHHSATGNDYTCAQAPSVLRSIYRYHVTSLGWRDIGYNFAIDKCGTIYEGRAGGVAKPVQGAHTLGFNSQTTGIAVLGTFTSSAPPAAVTTAAAKLTAWKLGLHGRDPRGTATLTSGGGNLYKKGTKAKLKAVSGHRDGYATECPGAKLYQKLGAIRTAAAAYQGRS
ncbi:peptidoglycan recognition protein [Streptomyces sp. CC228A]|uniref:peptidoglycan recognition protein family protein n=1 Tax=Streptomyces sp. CC228A TaxID=2898186 RepID=UPI001F3C8F23|nr:peptidoglycan recognition protein [Streptomyces sp. CC228A]